MSELTEQKRTWAVIKFELAPEHEEMASWLMLHEGASGCEIKKTADESRILLEATFDKPKLTDSEVTALEAALEEYGLSDSLRSFKVSSVEEEDWLEKWKEGFKPFTIGERITICPPWLHDELNIYQKADRHVIYIEPGMAFGTGLHPTTQYCMRMIEAHNDITTALDVGSGSGILAIACALLHENAEITAFDIDPQVQKTAAENFETNGVADRIKLFTGTTNALKDERYKFIFSNLTCEDILALLPEYERLLEEGGQVFCAGILEERLPLLQTALTNRHWKVVHSETRNGWVGLTIQR